MLLLLIFSSALLKSNKMQLLSFKHMLKFVKNNLKVFIEKIWDKFIFRFVSTFGQKLTFDKKKFLREKHDQSIPDFKIAL